MSNVRQETIHNGWTEEELQAQRQTKTEQPPAPQRDVTAAAGAALLVFGVISWLAGGKYTLLGWVVWLNWFLEWLGLPGRVPAPVGYWLLLLFPIAFLYSRVEVKNRPAKRAGNRWRFSRPEYWIAWALIVATDVGSTYSGVRTPPANAWAITRQIADAAPLSVAWSLLLTFAPEYLILSALRLLGVQRWFKR